MSKRSIAITSMLAAVALSGCATINAGVDPWARQAGVTAGAPVHLFGRVGQVKIYADGATEPSKVVIVANPSFKTAVGNALRQSAAEARAGHSPTGTASYTRVEEWVPAIYLKQKATHTLRIVRSDGREVTITTKPHIGKRYLAVDWILVAPTFFLSLAIDAATGKWQMFNSLDVDQVFTANAGADGKVTIDLMPLMPADR